MSALAEALGRAAEAMPGRFKLVGRTSEGVACAADLQGADLGGPFWWVQVHALGSIHGGPLRTLDATLGLWIEAACREECEARDWRWWVFRCKDGGYGATVYQQGSEDDTCADSPALALLLALLAAAEAEGGKE